MSDRMTIENLAGAETSAEDLANMIKLTTGAPVFVVDGNDHAFMGINIANEGSSISKGCKVRVSRVEEGTAPDGSTAYRLTAEYECDDDPQAAERGDEIVPKLLKDKVARERLREFMNRGIEGTPHEISEENLIQILKGSAEEADPLKYRSVNIQLLFPSHGSTIVDMITAAAKEAVESGKGGLDAVTVAQVGKYWRPEGTHFRAYGDEFATNFANAMSHALALAAIDLLRAVDDGEKFTVNQMQVVMADAGYAVATVLLGILLEHGVDLSPIASGKGNNDE